MSEGTGKMPLRRLEPPIHKFTKVVIPTDLQRLQQHQHNIEKVRTYYIHKLPVSPAHMMANSGDDSRNNVSFDLYGKSIVYCHGLS